MLGAISKQPFLARCKTSTEIFRKEKHLNAQFISITLLIDSTFSLGFQSLNIKFREQTHTRKLKNAMLICHKG